MRSFDLASLADPLAPCYVIAEIGVNHCGDMELAKKMILAAKMAGADAVKFQTFSADALATPETEKVRYQKSTTSPDETHYEMLRSLEFSRDDHGPIMDFCAINDIDFLSTPYDIDSARFLDESGVGFFKTASADIVDLPLHRFLASTAKPVIISTGMANTAEIDSAVACYGETAPLSLALLHAVSNYPCSDESLNLRVIPTLRRKYNLVVGFSDHSVGNHGAAVAVTLGAKILERHFTLDKSLPGPDHKASSTPEEFAELVATIRKTELVLGSDIKTIQEEEKQMAAVSRKSIVTKYGLPQGHLLSSDDLTMKRPGTGIAPVDLPKVVGKRLTLDLSAGHLLDWDDFE